MSVLVTGSIAIDQIMHFRDYFKHHILPHQIHTLNVAFLVPTLEKRWGGTGANIAYNLRVLGVDPILLATVGVDFGSYADWMDRHGVRRDWIRVLDDCFTAQGFITTDLDNNQLTSFHPGAMDRAHEARLDDVDRDYEVGIVAPNGKRAMLEYARGLKTRGVACVMDPGQGLPMFEAGELLEMIEGSAVYVVNDYELALTRQKTGLDENAIAERVGAVIYTRGSDGSVVLRGSGNHQVVVSEKRSEVPAARAERVVDPTGCGDAYRAGILYAMQEGLPLEIGARMGSLLGALKVAHAGPQSIEMDLEGFRERYQREFGDAF